MITNKLLNGIRAGLGVLLICLSGGCTKERVRPCSSEGVVEIALILGEIPEGGRPGSMKYYFYGQGAEPLVYEVSSEVKFSEVLPEGVYDVLIFNDDDPAVGFRDLESYSTAEVYALAMNPAATGGSRSAVNAIKATTATNTTNSANSTSSAAQSVSKSMIKQAGSGSSISLASETVSKAMAKVTKTRSILGDLIRQPGGVYGGSLGRLTVSGDSTIRQNFTPASYVKTLILNFNLTGQKELVRSCVAYISGLARGMNLSTREIVRGNPDGQRVLTGDVSATNYSTTVAIFGQIPELKNMLSIDLEFDSGSHQIIEIDITEALANINDPLSHEVLIEPKIDISKDVQGLFSATLTDWTFSDGSIILRP